MWPFTRKPNPLRSAKSAFKPGDRVMYVGFTGHDFMHRTPRLATVLRVDATDPQSGYVWVDFDDSDVEHPPYTEAELLMWSAEAQLNEERLYDADQELLTQLRKRHNS